MISTILISLRPNQWTKNLFLFAGIVFSRQLTNMEALTKVLGGFIAFCLLSSANYLINDVLDIEEDRQHPVKSRRPIPSGALSVRLAVAVALGMMAGGLLLSFLLNPVFGLVALGYLVLTVAYSLALKNVVLVDILTVAVGYVLRAIGGAAVIGVEISSWLLICTILLSLFLVLGKRRGDLVLAVSNPSGNRRTLQKYDLTLLDQMITITGAAAILSYALYTMSARTVGEFHTENLRYTLIFVVYGIFRYLYLLRKGEGRAPEEILITDKPLLINLILWAGCVGLVIYSY